MRTIARNPITATGAVAIRKIQAAVQTTVGRIIIKKNEKPFRERSRKGFFAYTIQRSIDMVDCIIIGSGFAGISAALTLQANGKSFQIFGTKNLSSKIEKAERIHNYPALADISGKDLCAALSSQLEKANIEITQERVSGVYELKEKFGVATQEGNYYESKTVIFACGVESVKQIDGETEFVGRGVSYCATCDGFLYKNKTIAVLCTTKRLEYEIAHLAHFAAKIYLIPMYKNVEVDFPNVEILQKMPAKILGEKRVEKLSFVDKTSENGVKELPVDGVFVLRESIAPSILMNGLQTDGAHIEVSRNTETNIKGCFAAGDITGRPYQYAKAAGEGNVAAHAVTAYLSALKAVTV